MMKLDVNRYVKDLEARLKKPKKPVLKDGTNRTTPEPERKQHPVSENITSTYIRWKGW